MQTETRTEAARPRRARTCFARAASAVLFLAMLAPIALAGKNPSDDEEADKWEGRLDGYPYVVRLEKNGTALTWMFFSFTAIVAVGVLFKNANRSHLD